MEKEVREIKFRGFSVRENKFVYGDFFKKGWGYKNGISAQVGFEVWDIKDGTIGQYTGIKDKHGFEIFEGDIVRYFRNELAVIVYRNGGVDIRSLSWRDCEPLQRRMGEIEVIGNIYEHKYLLGEEGFSDE